MNCETEAYSFVVDSPETTMRMLEKKVKKKRTYKGHSLLAITDDYVVLDLETTGLDPLYDSIIEIGIIRVRNGEITDHFNSFVNPHCELSDFITELTGITDEDLKTASDLEEVLPIAVDFIGSDIIVAHNANFDVNFMYDACEQLRMPAFKNNFVDTMRLSRRLFPELPHHRLVDLVDFFGLSGDAFHRASADIVYTQQCYELMKQYCIGNEIELSRTDLLTQVLFDHPKVSEIVSTKTDFDRTHPFYGQKIVFTGVLEKMTRKEAAQIVADLGGINCDNITKQTNYLVLGNNDYCFSIKDGKSNKQKKAEKYQLEGLPIQIISENVFYDMLGEE